MLQAKVKLLLFLVAGMTTLFSLGCATVHTQPAALSFDQLFDGDYAINRVPPFIPSDRIKPYINHRILISGRIWFWPDGRVFLVDNDRIVTPRHWIICEPSSSNSLFGERIGNVSGILRLSPQYNAGELETIYCIEQCTFEIAR